MRMILPDGRHQALAAALNGTDLMTVFQPIFAVNGQCLGFEALSRLGNGCPPDAVWDYAEEVGNAVLLDQVAIGTALASARGLQPPLFLNIRAVHLHAATTLAKLGSPAEIVWEVTESPVDDWTGKVGSDWLKSQGYALALDDAGSAWSTPERLQWLCPEIVKLDLQVVHQWVQGETRPLRQWVRSAQEVGALIFG
jgi:EAL domain-containing protein (putative c-di-GMP-specific phosphodiesterase class I)